MGKEVVEINKLSDHIKRLPKWLQYFFIKTSIDQGFIYLDSKNKPTKNLTDRVKWLDEIFVTARKKDDISKISINYLNEKYPEYEGYIHLF